MPLLIRELNIKVNVDQAPAGSGPQAAGGESRGDAKSADAETLRRAVEEVMRIEAARKER